MGRLYVMKGDRRRAEALYLRHVAACEERQRAARQDFAEHFSHIRVWAQTLTDPQLRRSDPSAFELEISSLSLRPLRFSDRLPA